MRTFFFVLMGGVFIVNLAMEPPRDEYDEFEPYDQAGESAAVEDGSPAGEAGTPAGERPRGRGSIRFSAQPPATARPGGAARGRRSNTYIIKKGDCLWNLSFTFLGDPFRWPEIWHLNSYISNPHLIYPGDPLVIPGYGPASSQTASAAEGQDFESLTRGFLDEQKPADTAAGESRAPGDSIDRMVLDAVARKDFFTPEFRGKTPMLWFERDEKNEIFPGNGYIDEKEKNIIRRFDEIAISTYRENAYRAGDTVDIYHSDGFVTFQGNKANCVWRNGRARIRSVEGKRARASVVEVWDIIRHRDRVSPWARDAGLRIDTVVDAPVVVTGEVFLHVEKTEIPYLYQSVIVDKGTDDGVSVGDIFLVFPGEKKRAAPRPALMGCTLHAARNSSTLSIVKMFRNTLRAGDEVRLVKRIQFK